MAKEEKIPNYIDFPYEIFLMLRLEFLALCQDEVEAKIMRIIEKAVNDEWESIYRERCATTPKNKPVEMPEEVWVVIPNRYFLDRLLGTVQSESTLKATMKSLVQEKKLVFRHERPGRYDAPEYTLNKKALVEFFATLPSDPRQVDMMAIMKQERKNSKKKDDQEGQKLAPSKIDPLVTERVKNWLPQKLTPSASKIDPLVERGGGQKLTPTYIPLDNNLNDKSKSITANADDATPSPSFANGEDDGTNNANTASLQSDHHSSVNGVTVRVDVRHSEEVNGQFTSTENEENNRLTSTPEPPTQQNVSTDESPLRIASETANETPSSPVIEPTNDEMIHADARKDGDSYSPQSTATSTPVTEQSNFGLSQSEVTKQQTETPVASGKGSGKRSGGKKSAEKPYQTKKEDPLKDRMEQVYQHFEEIGREMFVDPEFHVDRAWSPRTELYKAIVTLLDERGSAEGMHLVFMDMWNEVSSDGTTYWWREPKHLTLRALCKNYSTRLASIRFKARQATDNNQKLPRPSVSGMRNYTFEKGDPTPPPSALPYNITPQSSPEPLVKPGEQQSTRKRLYMKRPVRNIS